MAFAGNGFVMISSLSAFVFNFIRTVFDSLGWPGVVVLMAIESASIPLPSEVIMPLSGWMLVKEHGLGIAYVLLAGAYGALGCMLGSAAAYWVGRLGGQPLVLKYGRYILVTRHDLEVASGWFSKYGNAAIFYSRLLPVARTYISLPAGIVRMPFGWFLPLTFLGSFPWCVGLALAGYLLGANWEAVHRWLGPFSVGIVVVVLAAIAYYFYAHIKHYKRWSGA